MQFICYDRCTTCRKAREWLTGHAVAFDERPIKTENPTADELRSWQQKAACLCAASSTPAECCTAI